MGDRRGRRAASRPGHRSHRGKRPSARLRIAVAIETPAHRQGRHLVVERHLVDAPVTGDAPDPAPHVDGVIEVDEIGQAMDAVPPQRPAREVAAPHRFQHPAVVPDLPVATHADLGCRNPGVRPPLRAVVAVTAVDAVIVDMVSVIELYRLVDGKQPVLVVGRPNVDHGKGDGRRGDRRQQAQSDADCGVAPRRKQRGHLGVRIVRSAFTPSMRALHEIGLVSINPLAVAA